MRQSRFQLFSRTRVLFRARWVCWVCCSGGDLLAPRTLEAFAAQRNCAGELRCPITFRAVRTRARVGKVIAGSDQLVRALYSLVTVSCGIYPQWRISGGRCPGGLAGRAAAGGWSRRVCAWPGRGGIPRFAPTGPAGRRSRRRDRWLGPAMCTPMECIWKMPGSALESQCSCLGPGHSCTSSFSRRCPSSGREHGVAHSYLG